MTKDAKTSKAATNADAQQGSLPTEHLHAKVSDASESYSKK